MAESGWAKWARNGRLSAIVWGITFAAWLSLKIAKIPLESLDTVFLAMSGVFAANLGITTIKPGSRSVPEIQRDADKAGETNA